MRNGSNQGANLSEARDIFILLQATKKNNIELFFEEIKRLNNTQRRSLIRIVGNLNLPELDWEIKSITNYQYFETTKREIYWSCR